MCGNTPETNSLYWSWYCQVSELNCTLNCTMVNAMQNVCPRTAHFNASTVLQTRLLRAAAILPCPPMHGCAMIIMRSRSMHACRRLTSRRGWVWAALVCVCRPLAAGRAWRAQC